MDIRTKFYHVQTPNRLRMTLAVDVPAKQDLIDMMNDFYVKATQTHFLGKFGVALVHPQDQYVKQLGSSTAKDNSAMSSYTFLEVERRGKDTVYKFAVTNAEIQKSNPRFSVAEGFIEVSYLVHSDSNVVHISFVNVSKIKRKF